MSVLLGLIGLAVFCTSVVAVLRGHVDWARLPNRRRASGAAFVGLALLVTGSELSSTVQPVALTTSSPAPIARASTSPSAPSAPKAAADQAAAAKAAADQAAAAKAAQAAASTAVPPPPPPPAPTAQVFANCTDMHAVYPHGVGRPGAVDHVRGSTRPVTNFFVSEELYNANSFSDADGDGIACEKN